MRRREFIAMLGGAATWPLAARAQQAGKLPIIGLFGSGSAAAATQWVAAFVQPLRELGWLEGRNVAIEYRWAEGRGDRFVEIMDEFVRLKVAVVPTYANSAAMAAKQATPLIPIVFAAAGDPVGTGLVASLARSGGNVTGLSIQQTDLAGKRLEILRELVPTLGTLAIMANSKRPNAMLESDAVDVAARALGIRTVRSDVRGVDDIEPAIAALTGVADALFTCSDPVLTTNRTRINTLALGARLPSMHGFREFAEAGGLVSYGPTFPDLFRRAGDYVDKILRGAKPGDLPVEQPTKFELVINVKTAKALGLDVPAMLLTRADEVFE